ncbi:MAG: hypothetical protein KC438_05500, partial [Thermomicrobiales bacterium]|nr:hypothetical protein [Thermomicrobiales bacterium]
MHRLLRVGLIVALLASIVAWSGGPMGVTAQGQTFSDSMDSSATGLLSSQSPDPARFVYGYQNSQFIIQSLETGWNGDLLAFTSVPAFPDVSVAVDFSIAGDLTGKYAFVGCRAADDNSSAYMFEVHPGTGQTNLWRFDPESAANLGSVTDTSAVNVGSANNRIEIRCEGSTITGIANGQQVLTVQDSTYTAGDPFIGTGKTDATTDTLLTGFDNLTITELGVGGVAQQPTQVPAQPTQDTQVQPTQETQVQPTQAPVEPTQGTTATGDEPVQMVPLSDPTIDPALTFDEAFMVTLIDTPAYESNGASGDLVNGRPQYLTAGVNLTDFYGELSFITPASDPAGIWTFGFCFWADANGNCYDMFVSANGTNRLWGIGVFSPDGYSLIQSGDLPENAIDLTPGAENDVTIAVYNGVAMLSSNTYELDASVVLPGQPFGGDIKPAAGFIASIEGETRTLPVTMTSVAIWDLSAGVYPDIFGVSDTQTGTDTPPVTESTQIPVEPTVAGSTGTTGTTETTAGAGGNAMLGPIFNNSRTAALANAPLFSASPSSLVQSATGFRVATAGVAVSDFYATVTFVNPVDMNTRTDIGIGFRDILDNLEYRFVVRSDGAWALGIGASDPIAQGTVTNFDTTPGASNTLEIIARGTSGMIALNGVVIQEVDLSGNLNTG